MNKLIKSIGPGIFYLNGEPVEEMDGREIIFNIYDTITDDNTKSDMVIEDTKLEIEVQLLESERQTLFNMLRRFNIKIPKYKKRIKSNSNNYKRKIGDKDKCFLGKEKRY